ncbi:MAG TPA: sensor histidine kinase, partial [Thermoanaerobaculia bacterium]|nr:sensor histidine kinase [Thermoanaerobaculia bacterium]
DPEKARGALADVRRSAKEAMVEMQALLHQLTPRALTSAGLIEALREQCEALGYRTGAEVTLELGEAIPDDQLPPGAQETLFRIAQEALSNVARHARAGNVRVWLGGSSGAVWLRIQDDGQGFQPEQATSGMGMRNLKERAESLRGNLVVTSAPKKGTTIEVRIPFNPPSLPETPIQKAIETERSYLAWIAILAVWFAGNQTLSLHILNILLLLLLLIRSWWKARDTTLLGTPREAVSLLFEIHRFRALAFLLAAWWAPWHWRLQEEGGTSGRYVWLALAGLTLFLFLLEMGRFHKVSRFKKLRQIASFEQLRPLVLVVLPGAVGVLVLALLIYVFLAVFLFIRNQNGDLAQIQGFLIDILFLTTTVSAFIYVLSRQPRTEGVPS